MKLKDYQKAFISLFVLVLFLVFIPRNTLAANLVNTSATLSNSRLSFRGQPTSGTAGTSSITISASGQPDNNTNHIFPGDSVCFTNAGIDGCIGGKSYTIASISDSTHFNLSSTLSNNVDTSGYVVASESGTLTLTFTTASQIPVGGNIYITLPMADNAKGNDGIPDSGSSTSTDGFDLKGLTSAGVTVSGCTDANWGSATITPGSGTTDHTIQITRDTSVCAASSTVVVTISGIVNPSPITSGHTQGTADNYRIPILIRDGSNVTLDSASPAVSPIEGVLISTTIDQSLSFSIAGVASTSGTLCGVTRSAGSIVTTNSSIPWGTIATPNTFFDAVQQLFVATNASNGYSVTIEENDQMGQNGNTCTGAGNEASSPPCIQDTSCGSTACTTTQARDWTNASSYHGLGVSLQNANGGNDASFTYTNDGVGCSSGTYCARPIPDQEQSIAKETIMQNSGPVSQSSAFVCYRIAVSSTQPAGYYYNKVKYTATSVF